MSVNSGPSIVTSGLLLDIDAGNPKSILSTVETLVVAGGGGGGTYAAGAGGGGGGVLWSGSYNLNSLAAPITVTVGQGGAGGVGQSGLASNGQNSVFGTITAIGGGAGGRGWTLSPGSIGGSGGGGGGYDGSSGTTTIAGGTGTAGQGNSGGLGRGISPNRGAGGGGGGGGAVGGDSTTNSGGNGGIGYLSNITGTSTYYAGGGGGGDYGSSNGGIGGQGGGGNVSGGNGSNLPGGNGGTNTGGGGGGSRSATSDSWNGGNGGSGIVIVRYPGSQKATGGTVTTAAGDTLHTFTGNSTFLPNLLSDVSGNRNNVTLTNGISYNPNNQGYNIYDGVDDYANFSVSGLNNIAVVEMWANIGSGYSGKMFFGWNLYDVWCGGGNLGYNTANGDVYGISSAAVSSLGLVNNWKHYVFEMRSDVSYINNKIWINGVAQSLSQIQSSENVDARNFNGGSGRIASWLNDLGYLMPMGLGMVRIYNTSFTDALAQQNFEAMRGRYGV
jgi:hypothetical protein